MTRRTFVALSASAALNAGPDKRPPICIFSKHLAQFNYEELASHARAIGFEGIDLTVRPKGHVLPERAAEDMPRALDTIRSHGLTVPMITTDLTSASHPSARPILSTAARLKIPYWKIGYFNYRFPGVEAQVASTRESVAGLVALSREYGIQAGFHNHSGDTVGAAVWDARSILAGMDPATIGYYFDAAHARIEGGLSGWKISQDLVMPRLKMAAVKDFYWKKGGTGAWTVNWCPLGEGMVDWSAVFRTFAAARFTGPLSLHIEYNPADELAAIAKDFEFLKKAVAAAYVS
jgi:L-ribulose-5-phosphate 3-epimerase